ncbi:MAG TPA: transposase [Desulfuromonadales bacterium]|nr:transposase [Desulfuromonadales bacterium]
MGGTQNEFREEAVKLVTEGGLTGGEASRRLNVPKSTLENWVRSSQKGTLGEIGKNHKPLTELELEVSILKRENAQIRMERDILKKAAAYFAKESLQGTRS